MIVKEQVFGETAYLAIHGGKTLAVADDAQKCREACAAHALTAGREVADESATHRAGGEGR